MARIFIVSLLVANVALLRAQVDSTVELSAVEVAASRFRAEVIGSQVQYFDSTLLQAAPSLSIADILQQSSNVFIKSYGLGSLATTSVRGAGASHTAIIWNGFQIRSPMLGQLDLALLPVAFTDAMQVQYGGNSALWGSGAVGGIVELNNRISFAKGWQWSTRQQAGSFGAWHSDASIHFSNERFANTTRFFHQIAENNFPYRVQPDATQQRQPNAAFRQTGVLQETRMRINPRQHLGFRLWWQRAEREIPPTTTQRFSVAEQGDAVLRATLDWQLNVKNAVWQIRTGIFGEQIHFRDSIAGVDAKSHSWTSISEAEIEWQVHPRHRLHAGTHYTFAQGVADGYREGRTRHESALFASWYWQSQRGLRLRLSLRQSQADGKLVPLVPAIGAEQDIFSWLTAKAGINRNYRLPTFNDLYWQPGGNPALRPEDGWAQEAGLQGRWVLSHWQWRYDVTVFNRQIDDWIMWTPSGFFWSPQNIARVWSRGLEQRFSVQWQAGDWQLELAGGYDLIRSTNEKIDREAALGKQLIYVPEHQAFGKIAVRRGCAQLAYHHQYTGVIYTRSDHSKSLPSYQLGFLDGYYETPGRQWSGSLFFRIGNLWNATYRVIENRRMPGRNFQTGVRLQFRQKRTVGS